MVVKDVSSFTGNDKAQKLADLERLMAVLELVNWEPSSVPPYKVVLHHSNSIQQYKLN